MNNRDNRLDRHDDLIAKLLEQQIRTEEQLQHIGKSIGENEDDIKDLQKYKLDTAKILSAMGVRLSVIQWVGITVGSGVILSIIGYLVALLFQQIK